MFTSPRIWLVDSPENAENIPEGFLHHGSLRKALVARVTAIHIVKKMLLLGALTSSGKKVYGNSAGSEEILKIVNGIRNIVGPVHQRSFGTPGESLRTAHSSSKFEVLQLGVV